MPGRPHQARNVHGQERCVCADQRQPEVPAPEGLVHATPTQQGKPVVRRREKPEEAGHRHDQVKVRDHEVGIVQVLIEDRLRKDRPGQAASDEERDKPQRKQHRRLVLGSRAPDRRQPA